MDIISYRIDSDNEDVITAEKMIVRKLRSHNIRTSKNNSEARIKTKNRNKLDNGTSEDPYDVPFEINKQNIDIDSEHIIPSSLKIQKIYKQEQDASEPKRINNSQLTIRLPPIRVRQIDLLEKRKDDRSLKRNIYQENRELVRSNSNSITRQSGNTIGYLNIKGLLVNNREAKKLKLVLHTGNQENKPKDLIQTQQNRNQISEGKEELRKDIAVIRKKRSIIKKEKRFNNSIHDFLFFINWTNRMEHSMEPVGTYKALIGKGNNSILIKSIIKSRFWWNIVDSSECTDVNLSWTQSRNQKIIEQLRCGQELTIETEPYMKNSESETSNKHPTFIFEIPREKQHKNKTYCGEMNGLRKLASSKDWQNSKDGYSVEIQTNRVLNQYQPPNSLRAHNHLEFNWSLSNKKALYYNMKTYYEALKGNPFDYIPVTFHVKNDGDNQWANFVSYYNSRGEQLKGGPSQLNKELTGGKYKRKKQKNVWIIKPGENSNRGCGIDVCDTIEGIRDIIKAKALRPNGKARTHIIQSYIMPFLYNKRKFDIRCYILITSVNDVMKGYWYEEGYIRTSSKEFTLKNLSNRMIHLTNDAVQKKSEDYGKFENANKISFADFQKYLDNSYPESEFNFASKVYPHMIVMNILKQKLASDAIRATSLSLDIHRREYSFEIFGLDFMIDQNFKVWLIEVNTNPCLELSSPLLVRIIPSMVENALKIALDPLFPPLRDWPKKKPIPSYSFETNKFSLIFDSLEESRSLKQVLSPTNLANVIQIEEQSDRDDEEQQQPL